MTTIEHPVPSNSEAEEGILSCLLFNPRLVSRVIDTLKPAHFMSDHLATIYEAIVNLYRNGRTCTLPNVHDELSRMGHDPRQPGWNLDDLYGSLATLNKVEDYVEIVLRAHTYRQLLQLAQEMADDAYHQREGALERAEQRFAAIALGSDTKPVATLAETIDRYIQAYDERRMLAKQGITRGVLTHFRDMDRLLGGLLPSRLYVLAARPSIGKTSLALNIALNIVQHARHVLFFSLEMDEDELTQRLLSMETHIDQAFLRDGDTNDEQDWNIREMARQLRRLDLKIDDRTYLLSQVRSKATTTHMQKPLDLIVVDYLQLIDASVEGRGRNELRTEEVGKLSKGLKRLARDLKVPVLALAQLNRKSEEYDLPQLSHLGESSKIEQDSDVVMFIHCDESEIDKRNKSEPYRLNIIVRKHRNGRIGQIPLMFRPRLTKFETQAPEYYDEPRY